MLERGRCEEEEEEESEDSSNERKIARRRKEIRDRACLLAEAVAFT